MALSERVASEDRHSERSEESAKTLLLASSAAICAVWDDSSLRKRSYETLGRFLASLGMTGLRFWIQRFALDVLNSGNGAEAAEELEE
jgi:hypothetical protein